MNRFAIYSLKTLRKLYAKVFNLVSLPRSTCEMNPDRVSDLIFNKLTDDKPCMIARFGAFELTTIINYCGVKQSNRNVLEYIKGNSLQWWWNEKTLGYLHSNAGFFPPTHPNVEQFCELMLQDMEEADVLGSWQDGEAYFQQQMRSCKRVRLMYLDPYWTKYPWTKALVDKRILVVHPFADTIQKQYKKRELLFENKDILPSFASLEVIKAVQSLGGEDTPFNDWFEALDYMKSEIEKHDFDICLIGCGAYGFPLAAHVKRMGKKAVHMGGSLQLLFGIRGKRWEVYDPHYEQPGNVFIDYYNLPNEHWVRPNEDEKPQNRAKVEDSCYW